MDRPYTKFDHFFKCIIIGDSGVGKSCILARFTDDIFNSSHISTIGIDFKVKTISIDDKIIKLQIWDTAGQERFRTITNAYYRGSASVLLVYDITNQTSFDNVKKWLQNIKSHAPDTKLIVLIGNKCDLENKRIISTNVAKNFAKENDLIFCETSAKSDVNIQSTFTDIARALIKLKENDYPKEQKDNNPYAVKTISLKPETLKQIKQTKCC